MDHVPGTDGEAVAAGRGVVVVDLTTRHPFLTDTRVHSPSLVVRRDRDRFSLPALPSDVLTHVLVTGVYADESERGELVEHLAGVVAIAQPHRDLGVGGVGEAMHLGHIERAPPEVGGHIEYPAASDGGELRPIPDERDGRARFGGDGEQRDCGVLVEHPGLIHDHPLTPRQPRTFCRATIGASSVGIGVARREAGPHAVIVPSPPVRVHERRNTCRGHTEFLVCDLRGAQRRRNHPRCPPVPCSDLECNPEHRRLPCTCRAFYNHERVGRCDRGGGALLPGIQPPVCAPPGARPGTQGLAAGCARR